MRRHVRRARRRRGGAVAAALVIALAAAPAFAQGYFGKNKIQYQSFDWHIYRAPHFDIYYYPESEPFLEQMVSYAESSFLYLSKALDHEPKFRIPVIFYRTHAEFEQTNIALSQIPEYVGAFAEALEHRIVLPIDQPPDKLYALLTHEMTHIFEYSILFQDSLGRAIRGNPPAWLMEGLASHMANDEDNLDRMIIRDAVINGAVPPITKFGGLSFLTYRYGRAAFDFVESKWGQEGIRTFLSEYRKVLLTANIEKSIKEAFGMEADEFDRLFMRYLRGKYLPTLLEKGEPEDYGKEIGIKLPGVMTFSPVLSPSGDLIAVLTNRHYELDVVILSAKDGEVIKNLTKGFTNEYEFVSTVVFEGKNDLAWSPDGDTVAFFARKENRRILLLVNALTGREVRAFEVKAANAASPAFSPDGRKVLFSGNLDGIVDIFELNIDSGEVRNITDDEYYDSNPSWSSDGKTILYNRRVDAYEKVFLLDYEDPSRKTQITFGATSEITPSFTRDGGRILYCSDAGKEGIFNLYALDLATGEVYQYTDVVGGFMHPQERPSEDGKAKAVTTTYFKGRFRLFETDVSKPLRVISPEERAAEVGEMSPFEPPLRLTLDEKEKRPYDRMTFHVEMSPTIGIGVADDGTIFGNAALMFSDLLGDHRIWVFLDSVANYQNLDTGYINLSGRVSHYYRFQDYRDFILVPQTTYSYSRLSANRVTGLSAGISYPINRYYRLQGEMGVFLRKVIDPELFKYDDPNTGRPDDFALLVSDQIRNTNFTVGASIVGDTLRYNPWGPWHGKRFEVGASTAPFASGERGTFVTYDLDYRAYGRVSRRALFAFRLQSYISEGPGAVYFGIGGLNQLRGYLFREFIGDQAAWMNIEYRFPLVDELKLPFMSIEWIRGLIFLDLGAVWTQDGYFFDRELGRAVGAAGIFRDFKFYDTDRGELRDGRGSYGIGFNFRLGILELNWTFAKRLPFQQVDRSTCEPAMRAAFKFDPITGAYLGVDLDELASATNQCEFATVPKSGWSSAFYIGYAF